MGEFCFESAQNEVLQVLCKIAIPNFSDFSHKVKTEERLELVHIFFVLGFLGKKGPKMNFLSLKVELSPSKKNRLICFNESPLKMMKNAFYFILKALFVLKIFKFLC